MTTDENIKVQNESKPDKNDIGSLTGESKKIDEDFEMIVQQTTTKLNGEDSEISTTITIANWIKTNEKAIEEIEDKMFKCLEIPINRYYVNIRNDSLRIWTVSCNTQSENIPIVLVHGYCGAVGLWLHNIQSLSNNRPLYAFDLLGFGRSSRPPFSPDPIVSEMQFVESIEDWRKAIGLSEFILLGHSFGGYLATSYSLKYPDFVKALILADPWGFPERTPDEKEDTPIPFWISALTKVSQVVSPMTFFRTTGQLGVKLFKFLRPDFRRKFMAVLQDPELIYNYIYHANNFDPSGENGFRAISEYFGFAKNPMINRVDKVKSHIPIWFVYGSRSWIDYSAGYSAVVQRQNVSEYSKISVKIINGAGHHVYADKPLEFNDYINYLIEEVGFGESEEISESPSLANILD